MAFRRFRGLATFVLLLQFFTIPAASKEDAYSDYIVFLSPPVAADGMSRVEHRRWHEEFLTDSGSLLCSYSAVFHGFAARLTEAELAAVAKKPGFLRAVPDSKLQMLTTRTPMFMGLTLDADNLWNDTNHGAGVVVGIVDSGIDGHHASFGDDGVPEPPATWNGRCTGTTLETHCNRKLVRAKSFVGDKSDPRDAFGHGTHVAGIAAGNFVRGASLGAGLASGTAAGIAPLAHVAVYKACTLSDGCPSSAVSCAIEEAVHDGVDVINLSLGSSKKGVTFDMDPVAVAAFSAVAKGVVVVAAAGNKGPGPSTVFNDAPWTLTVAAGSVDRHFDADVELNSSTILSGESVEQSTDLERYYSIVDKGDCYRVEPRDVSGKLVICRLRGPNQDAIVRKLLDYYDAAGVVVIEDAVQGNNVMMRSYDDDNYNVIQLSSSEGRDLADYVAKTPSVSVHFSGAVLGITNSPAMAYFKSRGPSMKNGGILKPDVLAPGLNIISARSTPETKGILSYQFVVKSGTSMAAPHITGLVALLKKAHPDWSPAEIRSAIMTTVDLVDNEDEPIMDEQRREAKYFDMGAGHVNTSFATDPGLVYDIDANDYGRYICHLLGEDAFRTITRRSSCTEVGWMSPSYLNYPSIMVPLTGEPVTVPRTLTYVDSGTETFRVRVESGDRMEISVDPDTLVFSTPGEKKSFSVTVTGIAPGETGDGYFTQGTLIWESDYHLVRSPIIALKGLRQQGRL